MNKEVEAYKLFRQLEERKKRVNPYKFYDKDELIDEILKLEDKVEELMTLYTTEREVKEDYKSIIKEVREKIEGIRIYGLRSGKTLIATLLNDILEILDKGSDKE